VKPHFTSFKKEFFFFLIIIIYFILSAGHTRVTIMALINLKKKKKTQERVWGGQISPKMLP
jgi:uncharacterized membrane protein